MKTVKQLNAMAYQKMTEAILSVVDAIELEIEDGRNDKTIKMDEFLYRINAYNDLRHTLDAIEAHCESYLK